jgi:hypothetical protein
MDLAKESVREGQAAACPLETVVERAYVVRHLRDVVAGNSWRFCEFEQEQLGKRGLGSFDLRREQGLLSDIAIQEEVRVGQQGRDTVQSAEGKNGSFEASLPGAVQFDGTERWKGFRDEGSYTFSAVCACGITARDASLQTASRYSATLSRILRY